MKRVHRIVLGVVVGAAAVLGVTALATTADLGAGGGSAAPAAAPLALTTPTGTPLDPAAARRELDAARAELERARSEAQSTPAVEPRVVTVPAAAPAPTYVGGDEYGDDDHGYGDDDDHGGYEHEEDD